MGGKRRIINSPLVILFISLVGLGGTGHLFISKNLNHRLMLPLEIESKFESPSHFPESSIDKYVEIATNNTNGGSSNIQLEWYNFSTEKESIRSPRKKLLITQYGGFGKYEKMLNLTSRVNKIYAKVWNHDFLVLRGITKLLPFQKKTNQTVPESQSTYNKVDLLLWALESKDYDQILILDTDTLIFDFSIDLTSIISDQKMLVALKTHTEDPAETSRLNCGVTLWNLRHSLTKKVAVDWEKGCIAGIKKRESVRGDQYYLRQALLLGERTKAVKAVEREFHYRSATVIKHFIRRDPCSWEVGFGSREEEIEQATLLISKRFEFDPVTMEFFNHSKFFTTKTTDKVKVTLQNTNESSSMKNNLADFATDTPGCDLKTKATWHLSVFSKNRTEQNQRRLLLAHYSVSRYSNLFNSTAPINKLYAKKWEHDLLTVNGIAFNTPWDGHCAIPPKRAVYNKLPILFRALKMKDNYDMLLILDPDAFIYDFESDIRNLLDKDSMLAAHRIKRCDDEKTSNIYNGVTLWNLNHPKTEKASKLWLNCVLGDLERAKKKNVTTSGDQICLQNTIKRNGLKKYVRALQQDFDFKNGLVVRHFVDKTKDLWSDSIFENQEIEVQQAVTAVKKKLQTIK